MTDDDFIMRATSDDSELERLRIENQYLRGLLTERAPEQEVFTTPEQRDNARALTQGPTPTELEQHVRLFDTALSWIADYVFICDLQGRITYANRARLHFWQRELKDVLGKTFFELGYPAELAARIHSQIATVIATKEPVHTEAEYTSASGKIGFYDYILVPVFGRDGKVEAVAGSTRDMSDRHQEMAEKEVLLETLRVERERLNSLFVQAPAFIAVLRGPQLIFEMANPPYYQLVGHRKLIGLPVREAFPELAGQSFFDILEDVYRTGRPFVGKQMRILFQDAEDAPIRERYLDFVYQPLIEADGSISGIFAHGVDLTEHRHVEAALRESKELFRTTLHSIGDAVIATNATGNITLMNTVAEKLTGWTFAEAAGRAASDVFRTIDEISREAVSSPIDRVLQKGAAAGLANYTVVLSRDGTEYPVEDSGAPIRDETGNLLGVVLVFRDVTVSRRREQALQQSQARTRLIVEMALDAVIEIGADDRILGWNAQAEQMFGWTRLETIGQLLAETIIPAAYRQAHLVLQRRICDTLS